MKYKTSVQQDDLFGVRLLLECYSFLFLLKEVANSQLYSELHLYTEEFCIKIVMKVQKDNKLVGFYYMGGG